ncbi:glutathione S-transferase protein, partial [Ostertagia ostertagi]
LFALADQKFEDVRLTREAFAPLKESMPFGQMPVLEVDGKKLAQSLAINRYLAKTFGKRVIEKRMVRDPGSISIW